MTVKLPWVKWREGRPRAMHGPRERAMGFADKDLKHTDPSSSAVRDGSAKLGDWFTYEEAKAFSDARQQEILTARLTPKKKIKAAPAAPLTVEDLLWDWFNSPEVQGAPAIGSKPAIPSLSRATIDSYRKAIRAVIFKPESREDAKKRREREKAAAVLGLPIPDREREELAASPPTAVGAPELRNFYNHLKGVRGHHMALSAIAAISAAFTWGRESTKWRLGRNPRLEMEFDRPEGRIVLITLDEFRALVAAADVLSIEVKGKQMTRASIGDAIFLGLFTGQRQTDRLSLKDNGTDDAGRRVLKQSKTDQIVAIKDAPQLATRLAQARKRVAEIKLLHGLREMPEEIVIDETTGRPYNAHTYRHVFAEIRELAFRGNNELGLAPCPSLQFINPTSNAVDYKHDQDLRDTCVILLDRAGNDLLSICDVTGHSYQSAQTIMKHYRARNAARADVAIDRLVAFISKEGLS